MSDIIMQARQKKKEKVISNCNPTTPRNNNLLKPNVNKINIIKYTHMHITQPVKNKK